MPKSRKGSSKKSKTRKRPAAEQDEGWYTIRRILDERTVKGRVEYLVDWDDNIVTGQAYEPTWSSEVTSTALVEWERAKDRRLGEERQQQEQLELQLEQQLEHQFEPGPGPGPESSPEQQLQDQQQSKRPKLQDPQAQPKPASDQDSDTSQPPRPAHQRRIDRAGAPQQKRRRSASSTSSSSTSSPIRPRKVPRSDTGGSLYDEPPVSLVSSPSISTPSELPEVPDVELSEYRSRATSLVVEIPKNSNLNPADYLSVLGSQSSGKSTQSLAELENEDSRVAIVRNSQGTVPDSQEVTDRSWTQRHIPGEPPSSSNGLVESQPQDSLPESGSRVIPDSLEAPSKTTTQEPDKAIEERHNSSLFNRILTCTASEDHTQESHETASSDIPSRQPGQLTEAAGAGSPALSKSLSHNTPDTRVSHPLVSSGPVANILAQSDGSPIFYTQPYFRVVLEDPQSSIPSRILESPAHPAAAIVSTISSGTLSASDPGASQSAQIVSRNFETLSQQLTESKSQESLSGSRHLSESGQIHIPTSPCRPEIGNSPLQQPALAGLVVHPEVISGSPVKPPTPVNPHISQMMEDETPDQADERRRHELDTELSDIFTSLDEFDGGVDSTSHVVNQPVPHQTLAGEPTRHGVLEEKGVPNAYTELPMHSTDLSHGTQPPRSKEEESAENMAAAAERSENERGTIAATIAIPQVSTPQKPGATELADIFDSAFIGAGLEHPPSTAPEFLQAQQSTVSLADISRQPQPAYKDIPLVSFINPDETLMQGSSTGTAHSEQVQGEHSPAESSASLAQPSSAIEEHIVTLPFQASLRQKYNDIIREFKPSIREFNKSFSDEDYSEPDPPLINRIDELFTILLNICDYPEDVVGSDLETLPPAELAKYCCDANPKFNFIFELLSGIEHDANILIVARSPDLLRLLCHLAEALKMQFSCDAIEKSDLSPGGSRSKLILALPTEVIDSREFDVVIGYDHFFRNSAIARGLTGSGINKRQLVLVLVTTHSIEHIDLQIPEDVDPIERKSVLVSGIVGARNLVASPERGYQEPHEIAALFIEYLTSDQEAPLWEAATVPETILDVYVHSSSRSQMPTILHREQETGRKRKHDESDDFETKRPRVLSTKEVTAAAIGTGQPPVSDEVRALLSQYAIPAEDSSRPQVLINVPHTALQKLAEKLAEYERKQEAADCGPEQRAVISSLEKRVKEYERTTHKVYETQRAALQDRSQFETEKRKMEAAMQSAAAQSEKEAERAKKIILELEATVARLTEDPSASDSQDTPLAKTEKLWHDAQAKLSSLEKRLEYSQKEADYIRTLYQDASSTASGLKSENDQLRSQNEDLAKKASENFVRIHEIQERETVNIYIAQAAELKFQMQQRERELELAQEELRQLKNGRRETRQSSVPRSPRMGMLSPLARTYGGPVSRGASPGGASVEGMQLYGQQPRNSRYDHLR